MKTIKFSKMVATGNDFVIVDNRRSYLVSRISHLAKKLCDRKLGIGADGLLLLEKSKCADFKMRIFNPDGSEPEMCGNGSRCIALYAKINRIASPNMSIETKAGILSAVVRNKLVKINMTEPKDIRLGINIELDKKAYQLHYINTGVPHAVYFVNELGRADLFGIGRGVRYHNAFMPCGANADFVKVKKKNAILMRTYERGVEAETLACGTGAVASAIISSIIKGFNSPIKVHAMGGDLTIYFKKKGKDKFSSVFLEGEAREVYWGQTRVMLTSQSRD